MSRESCSLVVLKIIRIERQHEISNNVLCCMRDQQRLRPACAYAQSDQSLSYSLEYSTTNKLLTEHHLLLLSFKGGCTGSSESTLVKIPHRWKSHVMAQLLCQSYVIM